MQRAWRILSDIGYAQKHTAEYRNVNNDYALHVFKSYWGWVAIIHFRDK